MPKILTNEQREISKRKRKEYKARHTKDNYRHFNICISKKEKNVIKKLESADSMTSYIVNLIKEDLKK